MKQITQEIKLTSFKTELKADNSVEVVLLEDVLKALEDQKKQIKEILLKEGHGGGNWRRLINQL